MAKQVPILTAETDTAHFVAQGVLCVLAGACVLGVVWALGHGTQSVAPSSTEGSAIVNSALESLTASLKSEAPSAPSPPPVSAPRPASKPVAPRVETETFNALRPAVPEDRKLRNPQVMEAVEAAREVRKLGDTVAALESLRAADLREPNHPEITGEMALTYEAMGLGDKSEAAWRSVLAMGEATAGGYYSMAKSKLDGRQPAPAPSVSPGQSPVTLGACRVLTDPTVTQGQRITVRVPILAAPGVVVDPAQMDIHVFLFEEINKGERIEQVRADQPAHNWVSAPVDWRDPGGEFFEVTYDLSPPKSDEMRDLGKRSFHGYMVKLFYQDRLAGEEAQPPSLLEFTQRAANPAGVDNALFPK